MEIVTNTVNTKHIFYIFHGRFPSEKAHALYAAKSCEAFVQHGISTTLIVPKRKEVLEVDVYEYFSIQDKFEVVYIPTIDVYNTWFPVRFAYLLSSVCFAIGTFFYVLRKSSKSDLIITTEYMLATLVMSIRKHILFEVHDYPGRRSFLYRIFYKHIPNILTQNNWKREKLANDFSCRADKIVVEPNGVDISMFTDAPNKETARAQLGLPAGKKLVLYTGHLFGWKGAMVLAEAAQHMPDTEVLFVGGTEVDVEKFKTQYGNIPNIQILGHKPHSEMALWQSAADVLVLPNTAKEDISKYYTSPMKLFEYMVSNRPIVSSDLPSIRAVVDETSVHFFEPDNPKSLANIIKQVLAHPKETQKITSNARHMVEKYAWNTRAKRLLKLLEIS